MNTNQEQEFKVEIEKSDAGTRIRVVNVLIGTDRIQFDLAYKLVNELYGRINILDAELKLEGEVHDAQVKAASLWIHENDEIRISESVLKNSHRIALSLLRIHPECVQETDVVRETGIPRKTVNDQLRGEVKLVAQYFTKCSGGYQLTTSGLNWLINEILPQYVEHDD